MDLRIDETNERLDQIDERVDEVIESLNGLRADVARIAAVAHNSLVIGSNRQVQTRWKYEPLQKTVSHCSRDRLHMITHPRLRAMGSQKPRPASTKVPM
jgi:hypothetical protein